MSIANYGKKLINQGLLVCQPHLLQAHDVDAIWAPDFMESIVFIQASKDKYVSSLHFFWQSVFRQREVSHDSQAEEILRATHLYKSNTQQAKQKIQSCCPQWLAEHENLIPACKWVHVIWQEDNDVFILFEDDKFYYGWGWNCSI